MLNTDFTQSLLTAIIVFHTASSINNILKCSCYVECIKNRELSDFYTVFALSQFLISLERYIFRHIYYDVFSPINQLLLNYRYTKGI